MWLIYVTVIINVIIIFPFFIKVGVVYSKSDKTYVYVKFLTFYVFTGYIKPELNRLEIVKSDTKSLLVKYKDIADFNKSNVYWDVSILKFSIKCLTSKSADKIFISFTSKLLNRVISSVLSDKKYLKTSSEVYFCDGCDILTLNAEVATLLNIVTLVIGAAGVLIDKICRKK